MKPLLMCVILVLATSCENGPSRPTKEPILLADREAPLGWVYLKVYEDSTFEFTLTGLRGGTTYPGRVTIHDDTLEFHYTDSIPAVGTLAVIGEHQVFYIAGDYPEAPAIRLNKIKRAQR